MFFWLKKIFFKGMELGLGLKTSFPLLTKDPIFLNFRLSDVEAERVRAALPAGVALRPIRFSEGEGQPHYWLSYNLYELRYPRKELAGVRKVRCEINTFVEDARGRKGIYVFSGSPYVSRERRWTVMGALCDLAERLVIRIYGCGKLIPLVYELVPEHLCIELRDGKNQISVAGLLPKGEWVALSDDYISFNDISFFNGARSYDLVHVDSGFSRARFRRVEGPELAAFRISGPFFERAPDQVCYHFGEIKYLVDALNRSERQ